MGRAVLVEMTKCSDSPFQPFHRWVATTSPPPPKVVGPGAKFRPTGRGANFRGEPSSGKKKSEGANGSPCAFGPFNHQKGGHVKLHRPRGQLQGGGPSSSKQTEGAKDMEGTSPEPAPGSRT